MINSTQRICFISVSKRKVPSSSHVVMIARICPVSPTFAIRIHDFSHNEMKCAEQLRASATLGVS